MEVEDNEIHSIKTVLTVLGYCTKQSVSSLNKRSILKLEHEFLKVKHLHASETEQIDHFPSGFVSILMQIIQLLKPTNESKDATDQIIKKIYVQAKKVRMFHDISIFQYFMTIMFRFVMKFSLATYF